MTAKLYCFGESGNSYKAALPMELAGIDWEPVFVDFFSGEARSDAYKEINPMGEAPVLVDGDLRLSQSGAIQDWVVEQTGKFWSDDPAERREILRWQFWDNHKGSSQFGVTRFLMNFLPEKHRNADVIAFMQGRCKAALAVLEAELATRDWLACDRLTMADLSCCAYLYYPEPFGFDRAEYPAISAWLDRISETPGWKHPYDLMPGSPADRA
ncbi:glutathione S-transferase family protein [Maritimibacter sp. UBA3975]|uniref:glutathione S-transferase family protein n=1 Tax=Maritimibacter sp. UBA3975 TaxID=1946833 RepID=UPI000C0A6020|nr:glutathione S-transferase family protein [Maritimibacter sp. UBA3975]MAM60721.1 glutathione S-transferase [Maritimibacter sp.]|tara:strand:+ start:7275 stop:7910 length:636 start_codon:yes stop_codon:yes gene_type:complete